MMLWFFVISVMIIHLGMKPVSGGRPPRDRRMIRMVLARIGEMFHKCDRERVVVFVLIDSMENMDSVSIM